MTTRKAPKSRGRAFAQALVAILVAAQAAAVVVSRQDAAGEALAFRHPDLYIPNAYQPPANLPAALRTRVEAQLQALGVAPAAAFYDLRGGTWGAILQRQPLIPGNGRGNALTWAALGLEPPANDAALGQAAWSALRAYVASLRSALGIDPAELAATPGITVHERGRIVQIHGRRSVGGVAVRDSSLTAVVNGGNLVLFGARNWGPLSPTTATLSAAQARDIVAQYAAPGFRLEGLWREPRLEYVPFAAGADLAQVAPGQGYDYRLVWVIAARLAGERGRWEALVDARSGELLAFTDRNLYAAANVQGGIFPVSNDGRPPDGVEQPGFPMPFADVVQPFASATRVTNSAGLVSGIGATLRTTLSGQYVNIHDFCGPIDEIAVCGDLDLGDGPGTDCDVPPGHSAGDTHASRSAFYELNRQIEGARGLLPGNLWMQQQITSNMNIADTCNAFWDGQTVNFYRSGGGCANTGEIAAVFDHEWGHGLDDNDTNGEISSPGESIADIYGILRVADSCFGRGFQPGVTECAGLIEGLGGYGDRCLDCSGVRELDYAKHTSGQPHDLAWVLSPLVTPDRGGCVGVPSTSAQFGPCNQETHCEGMVAAEVGWDLFARDLRAAPFNYDFNTALEIARRLVYFGAGPIVGWYQCVPPNPVTGEQLAGCIADGGYLNLLAVDDDNGDLTDGTPHMTAIFGAFARHQIACSTPAPVNGGCAGGPAAAPALTVIPGEQSAELSWDAVPGAARYWVFRTEGVRGCNFGKARIGETAGTTWTDEGVRDGFTYFYSVQPVGQEDSCAGPMAECVEAVPLPKTPQPEAVLAFREVPGTFAIVTGDGDDFLDNCEIGQVSFEVENGGTVDIHDVELVRAQSTSHPASRILTSLPVRLADTLAGGVCGSPQSRARASFAFQPEGLEPDETLDFEWEVRAASALGPVSIIGRQSFGGTESDFQFLASKTFGFETGFDDWRIVSGTYTRQSPGAPPTLFHLASSSFTAGQCDRIQSPQIRLSPSSTLQLFEQFDTEPGTPLGAFDRANVGLFAEASAARTTVSPDGGRLYTTSGSGGTCVTQGEPGWNGAGPGFVPSTWSAAALRSADFAGQRLRLDVAYGTDPLVELQGFQFDEVTLTNFDFQVPDGQGDACVAPPPVLANPDAAETLRNTPVAIPVLANDFSANPPLQLGGIGAPAHGAAAANADGGATYTPESGFVGTDTFDYTVTDAVGATASATVTLTVAPPAACVEPGVVIFNDPAGDATGAQAAHDARSLALAQPEELGGEKLVFTLKMESLASVPPNTTWPVLFRTPDGVDRFVRMRTDLLGAVSFAHGLGTNASAAGSPVDPASGFDPDGTIRIVVPAAAVGSPRPGQQITRFLVRIRFETNTGGAITPDNMPNDFTPAGSYTLGNCSGAGPSLVDDAATTALETPVGIAVLANDSTGSPPLALSSVQSPTDRGGSATANADGTVTYTPAPRFVGTDTFSYEACDASGLCGSAQVTVEVTCPPVASGSFADDFEPSPGAGWSVETAANEVPVSLTWQAATDPFAHSASHSFFTDATTLALKDDRLIAPPQDLSAGSRLVFWHRYVTEGTFDGGVLEVSQNGGATWVDAVAGGGTFLAGGYDGTIDTGAGSPIAGRAAWTGSSEFIDAMTRVEIALGAFAGFDVRVRFRLVADPVAVGATPGVGWWIDDVEFTDTLQMPAACPLAPLAADDSATTEKNKAVVIDVLANDSDANGDPLMVGAVTQPAHGTATNNGSDVTYTPATGYVGADRFTYQACDPGGLCDEGAVDVTVLPVNTAPVAGDDAATTQQGTPVTIAVLANDTDADGDALHVESVQSPTDQGGTATANPDGTITYSPPAGFSGADQFTYSACDPEGLCDGATVAVTVQAVSSGKTRVHGSGWIPVGAERGSFSFNADHRSASPKGRLRYSVGSTDDEGGSSFSVDGTVTALSFPSATRADFSGPCKLQNGAACTYNVTAEDNGKGSTDRFTIRVRNALGIVVHEASGTLGSGNIQIR